MKLNIAIAGFGKAAEIYHCPFIVSVPELVLTTVLERHRQRSVEIFPWIKVVSDFKELIKDPTIDIVVITTPNQFHYPMAKEALLAGKHVVVDKPFTVNASEAEELIDIAKVQKKVLTVYHNRRLDGTFLAVKRVVEEGIVGEVSRVEIRFDRFRPEINQESWREKAAPGSGILYDLGSHLIDQVISLFGIPDAIEATVLTEREGAVTDDFFEIVFGFKSGVNVLVKAGMLVKEKTVNYKVKGSRGEFIIPSLDPQEEALKAGLKPGEPGWPERFEAFIITDSGKSTVTFPAGNYTDFYTNLVQVINMQKEILVKPEEALEVIRLINRIKKN